MQKTTQTIVLLFLCLFTFFLVWKSGYRYQNEVENVENPENAENFNHVENEKSGHLSKVRDLCPLRNFVFVKTHKTGSSTMSNILLRYAENNKLNQLMGR